MSNRLARLMPILMVIGFVLAGVRLASAADGEKTGATPPPVEKQETKKVEKQDPKKPDGKSDDAKGSMPDGTQKDPHKEMLDEIASNMKRIEDLLNSRDTGAACQELNDRTIQKLDELIDLVAKECQSSCSKPSSSSSSSSSSKSDQQGSPQQEKMREGELPKSEGTKEELARQENSPSESEPQNAGDVPNTGERLDEIPPGMTPEELRARQGSGKWGKLPSRLIEQMNDSGNTRLPEKYRLVLEQYWSRLEESPSE